MPRTASVIPFDGIHLPVKGMTCIIIWLSATDFSAPPAVRIRGVRQRRVVCGFPQYSATNRPPLRRFLFSLPVLDREICLCYSIEANFFMNTTETKSVFYEMLCVLPGTLAEDEVGPAAERVASVMREAGATDIDEQDMGKNRLAYPMKSIRYGYFRTFYFNAEPSAVSVIRDKVALSSDLLRSIVRFGRPSVREMDRTLQFYPVVKTTSASSGSSSHATSSVTAEQAPFTGSVKASAPQAEEKKPAKSVSLEEIDRKIDEILDVDLEKV